MVRYSTLSQKACWLKINDMHQSETAHDPFTLFLRMGHRAQTAVSMVYDEKSRSGG